MKKFFASLAIAGTILGGAVIAEAYTPAPQPAQAAIYWAYLNPGQCEYVYYRSTGVTKAYCNRFKLPKWIPVG